MFVISNHICSFALGPGEVPPESKRIAVVGDSYTGHFIEDEGVENFEPFIFPVGTINKSANIDIFNKAIESDNNYILFCTGVNDQALSVLPGVFETTLREHVKKIERKGKYLFVHTYMDYPARQYGFTYTPNDYDEVLRNIANDSYLGANGSNKLIADGGVLNLANNQASTVNLAQMIMNSDLNVALDVDLNGLSADTFAFTNTGNLVTNGHSLNITNVNLATPKTALTNENYSISLIGSEFNNTNLLGSVNYGAAQNIMTPIFRYELGYNEVSGQGGLSLKRGSEKYGYVYAYVAQRKRSIKDEK